MKYTNHDYLVHGRYELDRIFETQSLAVYSFWNIVSSMIYGWNISQVCGALIGISSNFTTAWSQIVAHIVVDNL